MGSEKSAFDEKQLYKYKRLETGQIRLLQLERRRADNQLQGELITYLLSDHPPYEALSYLWGVKNENKRFFIGHNKPVFEVWENLHTALHRIMALTDAGDCRTIWIDQICMNQEDEDEIKDQLKVMGKIYEEAHDVVAWLGDPPAGIDNVSACLQQFPTIAKKIELNVAQLGPSFIPTPKTGLPPSNDPVWEIIMDILHKDWYTRVWTLQEAVLAKRLVVYYGTSILDWELIAKIYTVYGAAPLMPLRYLFDENERHYKPIKWIQTYRVRREKGYELEFAHLLWTCGFKGVSKSVDRIYGMLGMIHCSISKEITVIKDPPKGKTIDPEDERRVFLDAFKAAVIRDHQLHLLSLTFERGDTMGLPTWCPNLLTKWNGCTQLPSYHVGKRSSDTTAKASVELLPGSNYLRIRGFQVDRISCIADAQHPGVGVRDTQERYDRLRRFRDETLPLTQSVYGTRDPAPIQYRKTLIAGVPRALGGRVWSDEEAMIGYQSYLGLDLSQSHPLANLTTQEKILSGLYASSADQACGGRRFIATASGRVGLAPAKCRVGDVIGVFVGACALYVLRPDGTDADTFSLVGDCYVDGWMESEAVDMLEKDPLVVRALTIK